MQIFVRASSRTLSLNVHPHSTVLQVKEAIVDREGIPIREQRLSYATQLLQDQCTLQEYHIGDSSTLSMGLRIQGGVQVMVKTMGKKEELSLDAELTDTIAHIKSKIQECEGIPSEEIQLSIRGKQLENDAFLSSINLLKSKGKATLLMIQKKSPKTIQEEKKSAQAPAPTPADLCLNNCGFFGSSKTAGYCSKCFKELGIVVESEPSLEPTPEPEPIPVVEELNENKSDRPEQTDPSHCWECKRKVGLLGYTCKCNYVFCGTHRYSDKHNCTFDYRGNQQEDLGKKLHKVVDRKVEQF